jgi:hypothetical protein
VPDRFLVPARGAATFDCIKDTTAKGFVITVGSGSVSFKLAHYLTVSMEKANRRAKKEYEEFTRHLNQDF